MPVKSKNIDYNDCVIDIRDVYKSFGSLDVLKGVNLKLYNGENLVVLGRSGTGKSVLIKLISRLLEPDKGTIEVLGQNVNAISMKELQLLRLRCRLSFQHS